MKTSFEMLLDRIHLIVEGNEIGTQSVLTIQDVDEEIIAKPKAICDYIVERLEWKHGEEIDVITTFNVCHGKYFNDREITGYPELTIVIIVQEKQYED